MDHDFVVAYLREALDLATAANVTYYGNYTDDAKQAGVEFDRRVLHIRAVVSTILPGLEKGLNKNTGSYYWPNMQGIIKQALYSAEEGREVMARLGPPPGPSLRADSLHTTVWDSAKSLWGSKHYRQAVEASAVAVNAALQHKLGRRNLTNTALVREAFTRDAPTEGRPRLRLRLDDDSDTYKSVHDGARDFGAGCFQALRNVAAHEEEELPEQVALEHLAAFSVLARWIEEAEVVRVEDDQ